MPAHWAVTQGLGHLEPTGRFTAMQVGEGTVVGYTDGLVSTCRGTRDAWAGSAAVCDAAALHHACGPDSGIPGAGL